MSEYFPISKSSGGRVKVELDLSNYATKAELKNTTGVDTSKFAKKVDLASLQSEVDRLDVDKFVPIPVDLSQLNGAVKNFVVKKDVYNVKIKNISYIIPDIVNLATNTSFNAKINEVKNEIPSITNLATTSALNAKMNEAKNKIQSIINLATTTVLTAVENKIADHSKYITTPEFNKLTAEHFAARLAQANLASKSDIVNFRRLKKFI